MSEIKWISCKEKLPEIGNDYLVTVKQKYDWENEWEYNTDIASSHGSYIDDFWDTFNDWIEGQEVHITHWAELPSPVKEE